MGHVRAMVCNNGQHFILVHLHQLRRRNTLSDNDHRLITKIYSWRSPSQFTDQTVRYLSYIIQSLLYGRFLKISESIDHLISCSHYCICRIHFLILNNTLNGTLEAFSLKQILLSEKNFRLSLLDCTVFFI